ncbi:hypothetical protein E3N88_11111 [Mikania micrantha]|uniref:Uncharacterized protein n=1 Tax=Mikania micrantha TaxID=192012 RepID=A0A5N6PCH0_9ASTR|nr:hypothetical protein E3N88_11111 [Mikania micrantha]
MKGVDDGIIQEVTPEEWHHLNWGDLMTAHGAATLINEAWLPVNEGKASHTSVILTDELTKGPYPVDNSPRDIQKDPGGKTTECSYK